MTQKFRLVVFDIGNVLLGFDLSRAARNFDRLEKKAVGAALVDTIWNTPLNARLETGRISPGDFYALLRKKHGFRMSFRLFCRAFNDIFTPIPANLALLSALSKKYPVALLSNTNEIHWRHMLRTYPVLRKAHWPVGSHMIKAMKPNPRAYQRLARLTGVPLSRMVYTDDRADLIAAARGLGITAVHCTERRSLKKDFEALGLFSNGRR